MKVTDSILFDGWVTIQKNVPASRRNRKKTKIGIINTIMDPTMKIRTAAIPYGIM